METLTEIESYPRIYRARAVLRVIGVCVLLAFQSPLLYAQDGKPNPSEMDDAILDRNAPAVRMLIDAGADVSEPGVLVFAAVKGNAEIIKLLLDAGGNVNAALPVPPDQEEGISALFGSDTKVVGATPLLAASLMANADTAATLIEEGADLNVVTVLGTPISVAATRGHSEIVELLIESGGDAAARNLGPTASMMFTPLLVALKSGHTDVVRLLVEAGGYPCPDSSSVGGIMFKSTVISLADQTGNPEVKALIDRASEACGT